MTPGRNGDDCPYGSFTVTPSSMHVSANWSQSQDPNYDYGIIVLPPGVRLSALGTVIYESDAWLDKKTLNNAGYPADKPGGTLWNADGAVTSLSPTKIFYMFDTAGGQSGSPVWTTSEVHGEFASSGVHGYGGCPNSAVRYTKEMWQDVIAWTI